MEEYSGFLNRLYYDPKSPSSFSGLKRLYDKAKENHPEIRFKDVTKWLKNQETYNLYKNVKRNFPRLPISVDRIDEQWQADLMNMSWQKD